MLDPLAAEREKLAVRLDKYSRTSGLAVIPLALLGLIDLTTGSLTGDSRIDLALLAAATMGLCSAFSQRRFAARLRRGDLPQRSTPKLWARSMSSIVGSFGFLIGVGYLIGGWTGAAVLPSIAFALVAGPIAVGLRRRRRIQAERAN